MPDLEDLEKLINDDKRKRTEDLLIKLFLASPLCITNPIEIKVLTFLF
jgi:hypothetical protein